MIAGILDENYERIRNDLEGLGLTYNRLLDDVLDHVCCLLEEEMTDGNDFESSYRRVLGSIGENRLPELQHQTLLNLDKRFQKMKKFTYLFGLTSAILTIIGSIFKMLHWPGSGLLLTIGIVLIVLVFLPLYFYTGYREQAEMKNPAYAIVGYLTLAFLLIGALFKIMHWPGANVAILASAGFVLIGFIPLYVVNIFQRSGKEKVALPYVVMFLVGIAIVMIFYNVRLSKNIIDTYVEESMGNDASVEKVEQRTASMLELLEDSVYIDKRGAVDKVHDLARQLQVMVGEMQEGLKQAVGQPGLDLTDIKGKDNLRAGRTAILDTGAGHQFLLEAMQFTRVVEELIGDPVTLDQFRDHLDFTGKIGAYVFEEKEMAENPLVMSYYHLSEASKGIALGEYVAISYLMDH